MKIQLPLIALLLLAVLPYGARAESADVAKLRENLRTALTQLRDAQNQLSTAQTAQAQSEKEKAELKDKFDALTVQSQNEKEAADKQIHKLNAQLAAAQRTVADRESKNLAMYKISKEILIRYEKFGLGEAIGNQEPFIGTTRVKLENLVQDYNDKLLDQRARPGDPITPPAPEPKASTAEKAPEPKSTDSEKTTDPKAAAADTTPLPGSAMAQKSK